MIRSIWSIDEIKSSTLNNDPCGSPLIGTSLDRVEFIRTLIHRLVRKLIIYATRLPEKFSAVRIPVIFGIQAISYAFSIFSVTGLPFPVT